jgi:hypothetical protein
LTTISLPVVTFIILLFRRALPDCRVVHGRVPQETYARTAGDGELHALLTGYGSSVPIIEHNAACTRKQSMGRCILAPGPFCRKTQKK